MLPIKTIHKTILKILRVKVIIPQMGITATAIDTGSAVKARTASKKIGKNNIVIDVFCASKKIAQQRIKNFPMFMKVIVEKK